MPLPHYPVQINVKLMDEWKKIMVVDDMFPVNNDGILIAVALDLLMERWEEIKGQKDENRFVNFYNQFMERVGKLQEQEKIDPHARKIRKIEEIRNASK